MSTSALEVQPPIEAPAELITPERLLVMPDGDRYELIDGQLVERDMGAESSLVATLLVTLLNQHVRRQRLGKVFGSDCGYQIFTDHPNRVRYADGSFIARGRFPSEQVPQGHIRIPPDVAIEVVSPNDAAAKVEAKRLQYLQAGVRLVWIVFPESRTVHVYRQTGTPSALRDNDELSGEDVVEGFTCRVSELFEGLGPAAITGQ
jgi:Uma2 family endonuclease